MMPSSTCLQIKPSFVSTLANLGKVAQLGLQDKKFSDFPKSHFPLLQNVLQKQESLNSMML